ncbi:hypothetical protein V5O48_006074 [Marasmius crinis-equi]|uniref:Uncharacterized protein n=1 Tax=Marasmius crinis-equi TaxID=585013 RepID=A0ABR3FKI3_9AGAR
MDKPEQDQASDAFALYPLTAFDRLFERSTFVTGWLVEGKLDEQAIASAVGRVAEKWRMLAGRVCSQAKDGKTSWFVKVPLGELPPTYRTYSITSTTSEVPLSHHLELPLKRVNPSLPYPIFLHPETPRNYAAWESKDFPLTCWHFTHFPPDPKTRKEYTCLGFARSHGVFDGVGAVQVIQAVIAELSGKEWTPPPPPNPGMNVNPVQVVLDELNDIHWRHYGEPESNETSPYYSVMGAVGAVGMLAWHVRERYWRKAEPRSVIIPNDAIVWLVQDVRERLKNLGVTTEVSTGDVLVSWLMKTIYSSGTGEYTTVHCSNIASFRSILAEHDPSLKDYLHNAWTPLPYPVYSVEDLNNLSLHELSRRLADSRHSLSRYHIVTAHQTLVKNPMAMPAHGTADESFLVSNVSASRILEADWSAAGSKGTICGYRHSLTPNALLLTNSAYISGRLPGGNHLLEVTLSTSRMELLEAEVERVIKASAASTS